MRDAHRPAITPWLRPLLLVAVAAFCATPVLAQSPASAASPGDTTYVVAGTGGSGLSLRAGPGSDNPTIVVLPEGTTVRILSGPISDGVLNWYQIQTQGAGTLVGYSDGTYLSLQSASATVAATWPPAGSRTISAVVTGYANGSDGGAVGSTTASGTRTHWGTVAADLRRYPFGTKLVIDGFPGVVFVVEDTGSGVQGDLFDVWFPDVPTAAQFGTQRRQVTVLPPGS